MSRDCLGRPCPDLPTEVPITFADSKDDGNCKVLAGDGKGPLCVSLDSPHVVVTANDPAYPDGGRRLIDRLGTNNVAPLIFPPGSGQINPALLTTHNIAVIKDTHGETSHLTADDIDAIEAYLRSLQR